MSRVKKGALELAVGVGAIDLVRLKLKKRNRPRYGPKLGCDAERNKAEITENERSHKSGNGDIGDRQDWRREEECNNVRVR